MSVPPLSSGALRRFAGQRAGFRPYLGLAVRYRQALDCRIWPPAYARTSELEKCLQLFQPGFALLPDDLILPDGVSRQYCAMTFNIGRIAADVDAAFPRRVHPVGGQAQGRRSACRLLCELPPILRGSQRTRLRTDRSRTGMPILDCRRQDQRRDRGDPRYFAQYDQQLHH